MSLLILAVVYLAGLAGCALLAWAQVDPGSPWWSWALWLLPAAAWTAVFFPAASLILLFLRVRAALRTFRGVRAVARKGAAGPEEARREVLRQLEIVLVEQGAGRAGLPAFLARPLLKRVFRAAAKRVSAEPAPGQKANFLP